MERELEKYKKRVDKLRDQLILCTHRNSHQLRAPLARILGLTNLGKIDPCSRENSELFELLQTSARELDEALKDVNCLLEECLEEAAKK